MDPLEHGILEIVSAVYPFGFKFTLDAIFTFFAHKPNLSVSLVSFAFRLDGEQHSKIVAS